MQLVRRGLAGVALGAWLLPLTLTGANWPQWRGPLFNGSTTETNLPAHWSLTENVAWVAPLPEKGGATPIIWDNTVFISSPDTQKQIQLFCLDARDGRVRWSQVVGTGDRRIGKNNLASPSPVTDGQRVIAMAGSGDVAAFDFAGKQLWARNLAAEYGKLAYMWLYGASPLLYQDRLYIPVLQRNPPTYSHAQDDRPQRESFLLCLDPATGKTLWRQLRPSDALDETMEAYTTPLPYADPQGAQIILNGANVVTAHRADTGEELWRFTGMNPKNIRHYRTVSSAVSAPGYIFAGTPKHNPFFAIKTGARGSIPADQAAWTFTEFTPDVCTPLYYRGRLFILDGDQQRMTCLDPATGKVFWQGNLGVREVFSASPTGADGKIYCLSERGTAVVLEAGDAFRILDTILMGDEPCYSSVVAAGGRLWLRTARALYCVGPKP